MSKESVVDLPEPPERVGPYRIEKRLGVGGMGEVYRAYDERLARKVAIKHIHSENPKALARLRREAKAAAGLNHPSIVQVYDILETADGEWVVMELVDGMTLRDRIDQSLLPWPRAVVLARQICDGLAVAHEQGIVHRDLKSENVMLTRAGRAKILDFGLAKHLEKTEGEPELSIQGEIVGTVRAMSPEQARGEEIDHRSDLFSLGTLFYEMLTGKAPFKGSSMIHTLTQICTEPHVPAVDQRRDLPPELSELIDQLLQKNPAHRPTSAAEVDAALARIAETSTQAVETAAVLDSASETPDTTVHSQASPTQHSPTQHSPTQHSPPSLHDRQVSDSSTTWLRPSLGSRPSICGTRSVPSSRAGPSRTTSGCSATAPTCRSAVR